MNELFHAFRPGFNWWYILTPAMLVFSGLIGLRIPHVYTKRNGLTGIYQSPSVGNLVSVLFSILWCALLFIESGSGIMQTAFNFLRWNDNVFWAYCAVAFGMLLLAILMYVVCFFCYGVGQNIKKNYLVRKYHLIKRQEEPAEQQIRIAPPLKFNHDDDDRTHRGRAARN